MDVDVICFLLPERDTIGTNMFVSVYLYLPPSWLLFFGEQQFIDGSTSAPTQILLGDETFCRVVGS